MGQRTQILRAEGASHLSRKVRAELGKRCQVSISRRFFLVVLILVSLGGVAGSDSYGQEVAVNRERAIKAAFLYQFSNYIKWPESTFEGSQGPFVIAAYQSNPFGKKLNKIAASKKVGGRRIEIRLLTTTEELSKCHVIFVAEGITEGALAEVIKAAEGLPVLLVGESSNFVRVGGDVQFFIDANKVRFAFHEGVSDRRGLTISSKLLSLSKPVPAMSSDVPD